MGFSLVDLAVVVAVVISGLFALSRGFVREALTVAGWVAAIVVTFQLFPYLQPIGRVYISSAILADLTTGTIIFVFTLILFSLLSYAISMRVRESRISAVDRSLGFVFGLARGAFLVCLAYIAVALIWPPKEQPAWLREARLMPVVERGGDLLLQFVPKDMRPKAPIGEATQAKPAPPALVPKPAADPPDKSGETGYKADERKALDRLLQGQQSE